MPQEEIEKKNQLDTTNSVMTNVGRKVLPREDVEVYSTGNGGHLGPAGTKHVIHAALLEKLLASGQVTQDEPAPVEEVKLTESEIAALKDELGRKPNKAELAVALKAKIKALAESEEL